jgi:SCY1-like protein 1
MKHTIYIVTEPVVPLSEKAKELDLHGTQRYHQRLVLS